MADLRIIAVHKVWRRAVTSYEIELNNKFSKTMSNVDIYR